MNRTLILCVYLSLILCGLIAILGAPSPSLQRQGGGTLTLVWSTLCMAAGCVGVISALLRSRIWEMFAALLGAVASSAWVASLILQGVIDQTWNPGSATCMGLALTFLLVYRARRLSSEGLTRKDG